MRQGGAPCAYVRCLSFAVFGATIAPIPFLRACPVSSTLPSTPLHQGPETDLVYPPEYEALRPFFDRHTQWGSTSQEVLAYHTLKDHFPELSAQEIFVVIVTARQLFRSGADLL
jgi:hypothetical protein